MTPPPGACCTKVQRAWANVPGILIFMANMCQGSVNKCQRGRRVGPRSAPNVSDPAGISPAGRQRDPSADVPRAVRRSVPRRAGACGQRRATCVMAGRSGSAIVQMVVRPAQRPRIGDPNIGARAPDACDMDAAIKGRGWPGASVVTASMGGSPATASSGSSLMMSGTSAPPSRMPDGRQRRAVLSAERSAALARGEVRLMSGVHCRLTYSQRH